VSTPAAKPHAPRLSGRRCRQRAIGPGAPRPSALLRTFFAAGLCFMLAAAAAAIAYVLSGREWVHWLALHLLLLGGISQLVLGAGQFFTCAFLATDPPPRRLIWAQFGAWNMGVILVAIGVPSAITALTDVGGALIAIGIALFAAALLRMRRRSLQRAPWALRWYQTSAACLTVGVLLGVLMARDTPWPYGSLLGAHLALNLGGWLGTAIVGTLHTFFPSLTQTQLRHPRLQRPTYTLWLAGVLLLAAGAAFGIMAILVLGWLSLLASAMLLSVNLLASLSAAARPLALPARLVALAQMFLPTGLLLALLATVADGTMGPFVGAPRTALAVLLLAGWIGLTVSGSLLHLLAVLARIKSFTFPMPQPRPARDRALTATAGMGVAALALSTTPGLAPLSDPAAALTIAVAGLLAIRVLALALRAVGLPAS
jgi:nitrite reductase (NO-forming)